MVTRLLHKTCSIAALCLVLLPGCGQHQYESQRPSLLTSCGKPRKELITLLDILDIPHDGSLDSIVEATQKTLLRKPGTERWQMGARFEDKRNVLMPLLRELGCIDEIRPADGVYDYALVFGALLPRVRARLAYLFDAILNGMQVKQIVFLGGARPLDPQQETITHLLDVNNPDLPIDDSWEFSGSIPTTETEMMKMVYEQAEKNDVIDSIPAVFVDVPMKRSPDGNRARPNTNDTVHAWLATRPKPGTCVGISNQPFVGQQNTVLRTILPQGFIVIPAGQAISPSASMAVILDNLARWLYQERRSRMGSIPLRN